MKYPKIQSIFKRDNNGKFIDEYSIPEFEYLRNNIWRWEEKIDGTNIRIIWNDEKIVIKGRTDNAQIPVFLYDKLNKIFQNKEMIKKFKKYFNSNEDEIILYGEGYGTRIQKGGGNYIKNDVNFILFDIKIGNWWLKRETIEDIAEKLNIDIVPILGIGTLDEAIEKVKGGFSSIFGDFQAEGLVLKTELELKTRSGNRIITKIKYKDFI